MIRRELCTDRPVAIFFFYIRRSANKLLRCIVVDEKRSIASNIRGGPIHDPVIGKFGHLRNFNAVDDAVANSDLRILERFAKRQTQRAKDEVDISLRTDVKVACQGPVACSDQQGGIYRDQQRRTYDGLRPEVQPRKRVETPSRQSERHWGVSRKSGLINKGLLLLISFTIPLMVDWSVPPNRPFDLQKVRALPTASWITDRGIAVRQGIGFLRTELPTILATRTDALSPRMSRAIEELASDWRRLDQRIDGLSGEIEALARQDQACSRLMTVPGIGPIISSAMVAAIGTGDVFSKGRDFGAWLGLVPKQISTGDRTILGKISRRGNRYLRALFVQAAWVVLVRIKNWERYGLKSWIEAAKRRLHRNVLAIALANKLARIAWAVLAKGRAFELTRTDEEGVRPDRRSAGRDEGTAFGPT